MKILFTGGGTGGHLLPIIAIARELRRMHKEQDLQFFYIGPKDAFGDILLSQEGMKVYVSSAGKMRRYWGIRAFFQNVFDIFFRIPWGILGACKIIFFLAPDLVFSKGGYGAIPPTIACWLFRIPLFLHESDRVPGKANRIANRFAKEVFVSFPDTPFISKKKNILVGNPIRREILEGSRQEAAQVFNLVGDKPTLFFLGGSQGAQRINEMVLEVLGEALNDFEIIHQTGEKNYHMVDTEAQAVMSEAQKPYYHAFPFLREQEMKHAYRAADFIVSRAGSGSIFEIAALGKPSIVIPLSESAQNHQVENAYAYAKTGAAAVLEEANLTPHFFMERVKYFLFNMREMEKMSRAALEFAKPDAARVVASYILEYLAR